MLDFDMFLFFKKQKNLIEIFLEKDYFCKLFNCVHFYLMKNNKNFKAIDFFCGGGGMTCGLRQAGIDVIAGVDFDGKL